MKVTTFEGIVENAKVRQPADVSLPERTKVYVVIPDLQLVPVSYVASPRLVHPEQAGDFNKEVSPETNDGSV